MSGKRAKLASDKRDAPRKHYCPECDEEMKPVKLMPHKRTAFDCRNGHRKFRGETILR